ncbi:MAG: DUF86 domain-containing protein [Phenylobacterium sp.]|nr:DUF86 domain-containing protein [Phenylobacterium sp.]
MPLEPDERDRGYVLDMILSGEDALEFIEGLDEAAFRLSKLHQHAVVRAIEIVGEAAGRLSADFVRNHPGLPWSAMRGMRHRLAHDYNNIDLAVVWRVARHELPEVLPTLRRICHQEPGV